MPRKSKRFEDRRVHGRRHNVGEKTASAHMKRQVKGREVAGGDYRRQARFRHLGKSFFGEFDGRRRNRVLVKIIDE